MFYGQVRPVYRLIKINISKIQLVVEKLVSNEGAITRAWFAIEELKVSKTLRLTFSQQVPGNDKDLD